MNLLKTSILNSIAVGVRMLSMLLLNKILALYAGPAGYAIIGQFQSFANFFYTLVGTSFSNGVTKHTAEFLDESESKHRIWRTSVFIAVSLSVLFGGLSWLYSEEFAYYFLKDSQYQSVFQLFAVTLVFYALNTILLAAINGHSQVALYCKSSIVGSVMSLLITGGLCYQFGLIGALWAMTVHQSLTFIVTLRLATKNGLFKLRFFIGTADRQSALMLGKFALMALFSAALLPVVQLLIRDLIGEALGWEQAGIWEAMNRLSSTYLLFVTTVLGLYYLPKFVSIREPKALLREIGLAYLWMLPALLLFFVAIYLFKNWIVLLLFSEEFSQMQMLFFGQLVGDFVKMSAWLLSYVLLSKGLIRSYIASEVSFSVCYYLTSLFLIDSHGIQGVMLSYCVSYVLYSLLCGSCVYVYFRRSV